jgi:hypothetical protein
MELAMGTPISTEHDILMKLLFEGTPPGLDGMTSLGINKRFLEDKLWLLNPQLPYIGSYGPIQHSSIRNLGLEFGTWEQAVSEAGLTDVSCIRLTELGTSGAFNGLMRLLSTVNRDGSHPEIFLTRQGHWILFLDQHAEFNQKPEFFPFEEIGPLVDRLEAVRGSRSYVTRRFAGGRIEAESRHDHGRQVVMNPALILGLHFDAMLKKSIAEKKTRIKTQERVQEGMLAINERMGVDKI